MKRLVLIFVFVLTFVAMALDVNISSFNANSDNKVITVEWKTNDETAVKSYDLERSNGQTFTKVTNINAKGFPTNYRFVDKNALALINHDNNNSTQGKTDFSYRLKIIGKDNSFTYSNTINVAHSVSSIRKTWGMLKEMFR